MPCSICYMDNSPCTYYKNQNTKKEIWICEDCQNKSQAKQLLDGLEHHTDARFKNISQKLV